MVFLVDIVAVVVIVMVIDVHAVSLEVVGVVLVEGLVDVVHVNLAVGVFVELGVGLDVHVMGLIVLLIVVVRVRHLIDNLVRVKVGVLVVHRVICVLRVLLDELLVVLLLVLAVAVVVVEDVVLRVLVPEIPLQQTRARVGTDGAVAVALLRVERAARNGEALLRVETVPFANLLAVVKRCDNLDEVFLGNRLGVLGHVQLPLRLARARVGPNRGPAVGILAKLATRNGVALVLVESVALAHKLAGVLVNLRAHNLGLTLNLLNKFRLNLLNLLNRGGGRPGGGEGAGGDGRPVVVPGGLMLLGLVVTRAVLVGDGAVGEGHVRWGRTRRHRVFLLRSGGFVDVVRRLDRLGHREVFGDEVHGILRDGLGVVVVVVRRVGHFHVVVVLVREVVGGALGLRDVLLVRVQSLLLLRFDGILRLLQRVGFFREVLLVELVARDVGDVVRVVRGGGALVVARGLQGFNLSLGVFPRDERLGFPGGFRLRIVNLHAVDDHGIVGVALDKLSRGFLHRDAGLLAELEPFRECREFGHRRLPRRVREHLAEVRHRAGARRLHADVRRDETFASADVEELHGVRGRLARARDDLTAGSFDSVEFVDRGD